jgi:hypothetical protein
MTDIAMTLRAAALLCLLLAPLACKRGPQDPCAAELTGTWVNASDSRYAYRLTDRQGEVAGEFFLRQPDGSATPRAPGEAPIAISLRRARGELTGAMRGPSETKGGKACLVDFQLRVTSCRPDVLQVQGEASVPLDESCQRLRALPDGGPVPQDLVEFVWTREKVGR